MQGERVFSERRLVAILAAACAEAGLACAEACIEHAATCRACAACLQTSRDFRFTCNAMLRAL